MEHTRDPRLLEKNFGNFTGEPTLLGRGGSQLVYQYPGMNDLVKVDYATLSRSDINGDVVRAVSPQFEHEPSVLAMLALRHTIKQAAKQCMGADSFPREQSSFTPFAMTGRMCRELWGSAQYGDDQIRWFRTFITIQELALPLMHRKEYGTVPLLTDSYEKTARRTIPPRIYGKAMRQWLSCTDSSPWKDENWRILAALDGPHVLLYRKLLQDAAFRASMERLVCGAIDFSNLTGQHIDIGHPDNVVLYRDGPNVRYLNVDPLIPPVDDVLGEVSAGIGAVHASNALSTSAAKWMFNTFGSIRLMNALAHALCISKRIKMVANDNYIGDDKWSVMLHAAQTVRFQGRNFPTQWHIPSA